MADDKLEVLHPGAKIITRRFFMNESQANVEGWMTTKEAAKHLRCSFKRLERDRWDRKLGIPFYKFGSRILYRRSVLDEFLNKHRVQ